MRGWIPAVLGLALAACAGGGTAAETAQRAAPSATTTLEIFALSDFHGWLFPRTTRSNPRYFGGIANIAGFLTHRDGAELGRALILDNGDMWTGPVESTLLQGEPVVTAYNALGVSAANVANHEFDFGVETLRTRAAQARFPFLGANVVEKNTGAAPDYLTPFVVLDRNGVRVGVIGLCFVDTPATTKASNVEGLEFRPYAETLKTVVPKVRTAGAEVLVVLLHDTPVAAGAVVEALPADLRPDLVVAGQDHRRAQLQVAGTPVVNPGAFGASYARFEVSFDLARREVLGVSSEIIEVTGPVEAPTHPPVETLADIARDARRRTETLASEPLGDLGAPAPVGDFAQSTMGNLIVDAWLEAFPEEADLAIVNHGGIRQDLPAGPVTLGDITGVMPFENNIYLLELTGAEVMSQLAIDHPVVGGMTWTYRENATGREVIEARDRDGNLLVRETTYRVAVLDFMYTGGDGYEFAKLDNEPIDTGLSWREPVMRALRAAASEGRALVPDVARRAQEVSLGATSSE